MLTNPGSSLGPPSPSAPLFAAEQMCWWRQCSGWSLAGQRRSACAMERDRADDSNGPLEPYCLRVIAPSPAELLASHNCHILTFDSLLHAARVSDSEEHTPANSAYAGPSFCSDNCIGKQLILSETAQTSVQCCCAGVRVIEHHGVMVCGASLAVQHHLQGRRTFTRCSFSCY